MKQAMQAVVHALASLAAAAALCGPVHAMQQSELQSLAEGTLLEDTFGAGIACRGTRALIGAPNMSLTAQSSGAVFAFRYEGGIWRSAGPLALPVVGAGDHVGGAVCIDGDWAAIGVPYKDASGVNEGVVCVLYANQSAVGWTVSEILRPTSLETGDGFGYVVAIDGDTLVASAPGDDDASPSAGAAYVYRRLGNAWVLEQKLVPPAASLPLSAGASVSVCGSTVVLGSTGNDFFVFERVGGTWTLAGAFEDLQNHYDDFFGRSVSLENETIVVGEPSHGTFQFPIAGAAFIYERNGAGAWIRTQELHPSDAYFSSGGGDDFGRSVHISQGRIVIGAPGHDVNGIGSGQAYIYERDASGQFVETLRLVASDGAPSDQLGMAVAFNGPFLFAGAPYATAQGVRSGKAYVYDVSRGVSYGQGGLNALGLRAELLAYGPQPAFAPELGFFAVDVLPESLGGVIAARSAGNSTIGGPGGPVLLLGAPLVRLSMGFALANADGLLSLQIDKQQSWPLGVVAGDTWYFQAWYRGSNALTGIHLSSAVRATFH
jgi:hypothetical protein